MSKLTQIENALRGADGATFQQLCDLYLEMRGYRGVNPLGRIIGSAKVAKGIPDSWIRQENGKFIFAEHTNQAKGVGKKLLEGLMKCLDEQRTGVTVARIAEIVFCHASVLAPREEDALVQIAGTHGVVVTTIGIGPLAHDLYQKYPGLARDFLKIAVDTGQIVDPDEFVRLHGNHRLATPLDTPFHFRESEVGALLAGLLEHDVVLVSGRAGVGKSRLALEGIRRFREANPDHEIICIYDRGADLFEDLRVHLAVPGRYVVFVDDANRVGGFGSLLQMIRNGAGTTALKVIATVRDYGLAKVRDVVRQYVTHTEIDLSSLADEQIRELVFHHTRIGNPLALDRIASVVRGNPRLALMAAQVAVRENTLDSIANVSVLYDEYFQSVRNDLSAIGDREHLRVGAIVAFYRVVDRSDSQQMQTILDAFGVSSDVFWAAVLRLHDMELLDMYENEVVKISDQVLATYLLYLAFFRERELEISVLLHQFVPRHSYRVQDALLPVFSAFDSQQLAERIRLHLQDAWKAAAKRGDENHVLHLMDIFWFVMPTDVVLALGERIRHIEPGSREELSFDYTKASGPGKHPLVLSILGKFRFADEWLRMAVDLLLDYAAREPSDLPRVLSLLVDGYGIRHESAIEGFRVEQAVVDALVARIESSDDPLFKRMFFVVAGAFLRTRFCSSELWGKRTMVSRKIKLRSDSDLRELRNTIWRQLFALACGLLRGEALAVLRSYSAMPAGATVHEIVEEDARQVLPFIDAELDPQDFADCLLVHGYLRLLRWRGVSIPRTLGKRFQSETYRLFRLFSTDWEEEREIGREQYRKRQKDRLREYFSSAGAREYETAFSHAATILATLPDDYGSIQVRIGIERALLHLAERDEQLFLEVVWHYLASGNELDLRYSAVIAEMIQRIGAERTHDLLNKSDYRHKVWWLLAFHSVLPPEDVNAAWLRDLYALYQQGAAPDLPYDLAYLVKYESVDPGVIPNVVSILVEKAEKEPWCATSLNALFLREQLSQELRGRLIGRVGLMKRAYLALQLVRGGSDHDGSGFNMLLNLDPTFGREYVEWIFAHGTTRDPLPRAPSPDHDSRRYDFIWKRRDHTHVMEAIVRRVYELERDLWAPDPYVSVFFSVHHPRAEAADTKVNGSIREIQDRFLEGLLQREAGEANFVEWLFALICEFTPERRVRLLRAWLQRNSSFADFERLSLEPDGWMANGSFVPVYQKRVEVLEGFLPLFHTAEFLRHRQYVERRIAEYRIWIASEKKRDFMDG